jgi:hypothetical protein
LNIVQFEKWFQTKNCGESDFDKSVLIQNFERRGWQRGNADGKLTLSISN